MTEVTRKRRKGQPPLGGPGAGIVELEASQHLKTAGLRVPVQSGRPGNLLELEQQSAGNGRAAAQPPPWPGAAEATEAAPQASTTATDARRARVERELALATLAAGALAVACAARLLLGGGPAWRPMVVGLVLPVTVVTTIIALSLLERPDPARRRALRRSLWAALATAATSAALVLAG